MNQTNFLNSVQLFLESLNDLVNPSNDFDYSAELEVPLASTPKEDTSSKEARNSNENV